MTCAVPRRGGALRVGGPIVVTLVMAVLATFASTGVAWAHSGGTTPIVRLEQTLGDRDLSLTIAPPPGAGTMPVLVSTVGDAPPAPVRLGVAPPGGSPGAAATTVTVGRGIPPARVDLPIDRPGDWELVVDDGRDTARVPVRATAAPTPASSWVAVGGFAVAVLGLLVAVSVRRRRGWSTALGGVALVALTVAVTIRVVATPPADPGPVIGGIPPSSAGQATAGNAAMPDMPGMAMPGMTGPSTADGSVDLQARLAPGAAAGAPVALDLALTDGASGRPVDDLEVHDEALIHLVVVGPGGQFSHVHPIRTGPGRYLLRTTPPASGRYGLFAEVERASGGVQLARSWFTVPGPAAAPPAPPPGPGVRDVAGMRAEVRVTAPDTHSDVATVTAGEPVRLGLTLTDRGVGVTDLQPWLGMAGHLVVLGPGPGGSAAGDPADVGRTFGHVHDMRAPGPGGGFGPEAAFDYTFSGPGRYLLWIQVRRADRVITVPSTIDVIG